AGFAGSLSYPAPGLRLRPASLTITHHWPLKGLVKEGDTLYVEACADDFNTISPFNPAGRSGLIVLHIISRPELTKLLEGQLKEVQEDLVKIQELQDKAIKNVKDIKDKLRDKKLDQKKKDKLIEQIIDAEQMQKQVEKEVGTKADEGVRSK